MYTRIPTDLLADLRANGASIVDISALLGCSRNGVSKVVSRLSIPKPPPVVHVRVVREKVRDMAPVARPSDFARFCSNPFQL